MDSRQEQFRARLSALGFDDVRCASLASPMHGGLPAWLEAGMQADMNWMTRSAEKRLDPQRVLPGAKSIVMLGVSYWNEWMRFDEAPTATELSAERNEGRPPSRGRAPRWARYALHEDYHDTVKPGLVAAGKALEEIYGVGGTDYRYYVDTGPVLERSWAGRAGLGFVGKNAMLISRRHGNWLLLAAILTRVELRPDEAIRHRFRPDDPAVGLLCGKCTRCLDACPTNAFPRPGVVDARRCISYQTIENKGIIPRELRAGIGNRIYGCDVCLEVCPWNRFAQAGRALLLSSRQDLAQVTLEDLLALTPERFAEIFRRTPIKRLKLVGLLRNACVVAGNSGDATLLPQLVKLATSHESTIVRAHAVWAVIQLQGGAHLLDARARELDPVVRAEYDQVSAET
jgi:epoxyqueuosine reductase